MKIYNLDLEDLFSYTRKGTEVLKCVVIPDKHFPHHCKKTHQATLSFLRDYKPHVLISIGDWWEMAAMSHWEGNANFQLLREELSEGIDCLNEMVKACGKGLEYRAITLGNHEKWYDRIISSQVPGLKKFLKQSGMDLHFANVSGLEENGFEVFEYNEVLRIGDVGYTHGNKTGKYHSFQQVDVLGMTTLYGHTETQQLHTKIDARGVIQGISLGTQRDESQCLFMDGRASSWVTALGIVEYTRDGNDTIYNPKITGGKFSFNGRVYS